MNLEQLMKMVNEEWVFDKNNYPPMKTMSQKEKRLFSIRHILMHQAKALAKAMETLERFDQGKTLDEEGIRLSARNFFINTLRMLSVIQVSSEELVSMVQQWADEKHKP